MLPKKEKKQEEIVPTAGLIAEQKLKVESEKELDYSGLLCPMPIVNLAEELKDKEYGQRIRVISDDEAFDSDIKAWCELSGNLLVDLKKADKTKAVVEKKAREE